MSSDAIALYAAITNRENAAYAAKVMLWANTNKRIDLLLTIVRASTGDVKVPVDALIKAASPDPKDSLLFDSPPCPEWKSRYSADITEMWNRKVRTIKNPLLSLCDLCEGKDQSAMSVSVCYCAKRAFVERLDWVHFKEYVDNNNK